MVTEQRRRVIYKGLEIETERLELYPDGSAEFDFIHAGQKLRYRGWLQDGKLVWIDPTPPGDSMSERTVELLQGFAIGALVSRLGAKGVAGKLGRDVPMRRKGI